MYDYYYDEPNYTPYIIGVLILDAIFCVITANIAKKKGRDPILYGILGFVLPIIGLIIVLVQEDLSKKNMNDVSNVMTDPHTFKRNLSVDEWYLDLPFEIDEKKIIISPDKSKAWLSLVMLNIGEKAIQSVYFNLECFDDTWEPACTNNKLTYAYQDLNITQYERFGNLVKIELPDPKTRNVNIEFEKMAFTDGTVLKLSDINEKESLITERTELTLAELRVVDDKNKSHYRFRARYMPVFQPDGKWLCVCGRTNKNTEQCAFCGRNKDDVRIDFDKDVLEKKWMELKQQSEVETETEKTKKRKITKIAIPIVALVIVVFCAVAFFLPNQYEVFAKELETELVGNWYTEMEGYTIIYSFDENKRYQYIKKTSSPTSSLSDLISGFEYGEGNYSVDIVDIADNEYICLQLKYGSGDLPVWTLENNWSEDDDLAYIYENLKVGLIESVDSLTFQKATGEMDSSINNIKARWTHQ